MNSVALLVIDLQRGAFDSERCSPIDQPHALVERATMLIRAAHDAGKPVIFIQHCDGAGEVFEEGSPHWELHEELPKRADDTVLKKYASSAFEGTDLSHTLEDLKVRELVLCGLQSEFCVFNTAKSALALGYEVSIAKDGHGTWPSAGKSASAISEGINLELEAAGAELKAAEDLALLLREART